MVTNSKSIQDYLKEFDFEELFVDELSWNRLRNKEHPFTITCKEQTYTLRPVAEKQGMKVYLCDPDEQGQIPHDDGLRAIDREVTKYANQHLIIYVDAAHEKQTWQWVRRRPGKPIAMRLKRFHKSQSGTALAQQFKALEVALEEELSLTHLDVTGRVEKAFDVEKVTKRFYDRFQKEHTVFKNLITGIHELNEQKDENRSWYTSVMLNRLMFIYFIQRQGFLNTKNDNALDGDTDYLRDRLHIIQQQNGTDQFHSFYRYFLLHLFHDGLSKREHSREMEKLLGKVPYLNGGLFDVHMLEREYTAIDIPDGAFERIFDFFDEFQWHLDDRPLHKDNEINPDVLGYIFEKYINQKQMGAYYTKEDITAYISKNTVIPYLFEAAEQKCLLAFRPDGAVWSLLRENPDRYIYDTLKKGIHLTLPPEIAAGVADSAQRSVWNRSASAEYALPTETWREVVARRKRYAEIKTKLAAGEVRSINDLITYNLDIRQFAQDVITYCEGINLLHAFYDTIEHITILDHTCGSGAFLFAALNIQEPLYEACLDRMQIMVEECDRLDAGTKQDKLQKYPRIEYFRTVLKQIGLHSKRAYFILKSIIINNLYGVDIMEEATEIYRLRLFLKLVAQIEKFSDIEPLPDIDFNVRAGNTLVGFASQKEVRKAVESDIRSLLTSSETLERIERKAQEIEHAVENFRKLQTEPELARHDMALYKQELHEKLEDLCAELDPYLASEYGIDRNSLNDEEEYTKKYEAWRRSHQPLHWFVEFYGIITRGGFSVIVGNPPYVEYSKVKKDYTLQGYQTQSCANLYAFVMEQCLNLIDPAGRYGLIVPISAVSLEECAPLQNCLQDKLSSIWVSHFGIRPAKLFEGAEQRLTIVMASKLQDKALYSTGYNRWSQEERAVLFQKIHYQTVHNKLVLTGTWAKVADLLATGILNKLFRDKPILANFFAKSSHNIIHYHRSPGYWIRSMNFEPYFKNKSGTRSTHHYRDLSLNNPDYVTLVGALLSSNLFFFWFNCYSNVRNISKRDIEIFPADMERIFLDTNLKEEIKSVFNRLMIDLRRHSQRKVRIQGSDKVEYDEFYPSPSKPIMDQIDRVLAKHYGFTDEELDFIINYDIKYRMGQESGEGDEPQIICSPGLFEPADEA